MPIRPELRHFYRGPAWRATRARIIARAGDKCEQCGKPNHTIVYTYTAPGTPALMVWCPEGGSVWTSHRGTQWPTPWPHCGLPRKIRVVLTVAHLNHTPGDDRDENLRALCQWCHLHMDAPHHKRTRSKRKDAARPLLQEATNA